MRAFSQPDRLRFMLADFHALWEKWELAEPVYMEFFENPRSSREIKACALRALGEAARIQGRSAEARQHLQQVVNKYGNTVSAQRAMLTLGLESRATVEQRAERLLRAYEMNPNSEDGEVALFQLGFMYYANMRSRESLDVFRRFASRYPRSRYMDQVSKYIERQRP